MARPTHQAARLAELTQQAAASRLVISEGYIQLRNRLDVSARIKESIANHPTKWVSGTLAAGLFVSRFFKTGKKAAKIVATANGSSHGLLFRSAAMIFSLSKPFLKTYALKILQDYLRKRYMSDQEIRSSHYPQ
jgi:hypothetical protein